jgi:hypothetical protein
MLVSRSSARTRTCTLAVLLGGLALISVDSANAQETGGPTIDPSNPPEVTKVTTGTLAIEGLQNYIQKYAEAVIPSTLTATVANPGKFGAFAVYNPATGKTVAVGGIGGTGTIQVTGAQVGGSGRAVAVGGVLVDLNTYDAGAGTINYYQVNCTQVEGAQCVFPVDATVAGGVYNEIFGTGALKEGETLTAKTGPKGSVYAYCYSGSVPKTWTAPNGKTISGTLFVIKAIVKLKDKVAAIHVSGAGGVWTAFSQGAQP